MRAAGVWMLLLPLAVMLPIVCTVVAGSARDKSWKARAREGALAYALLASLRRCGSNSGVICASGIGRLNR